MAAGKMHLPVCKILFVMAMMLGIPLLGVSLLAIPLTAVAQPRAAAIRWQEAVDIASGRGEKGPWQQNNSRYDYVDDPTVALDAAGNAALAWVEQSSKNVFFQVIAADGAKRGKPINVSRSPATFSWLPRLLIARDDPNKIYVIWQEIIFSGGSHGGDILLAVSHDGGMTFSPPRNLSESIGGDGKGRLTRDIWSNGSLDLARDDKGVLYAVWTEYDGMLWLARSSDDGKSFSRPRRIAGEANRPARGPALATGPGKAVYLAWTVGEDPAAAIHVARSTDGGETFSEPQLIGRQQGHADAPRLVWDGNGTLHLVFAQSASGPLGRYAIRYARSDDGGKSFSAPQSISAGPPNGASGAKHPNTASTPSAHYPAISTDAQGRLFVLWEAYPDPKAAPRGLAYATSADGGKTFTRPAMVPGSLDPAGGSNGSHQGLLMNKLAMNDKGEVAIVNSSLRVDVRSRVWLIRGSWTP